MKHVSPALGTFTVTSMLPSVLEQTVVPLDKVEGGTLAGAPAAVLQKPPSARVLHSAFFALNAALLPPNVLRGAQWGGVWGWEGQHQACGA